MEEHTRSLMDYVNVLRKHKTPALITMILIVILSAAVAVLLPPTFRSSATILIEQQAIPTELVQTTVTSYATERLRTIEARVMSRTNLLKIIEKFNLYPEKIKVETTEQIVARMRKNAAMKLINASGSKGSQGAIAFTLSFSSDKASTAQKVAHELTDLYLEQNVKSRTREAEDTSEFLRAEVERIGKDISDLELQLSTFKQKNNDLLPERQTTNHQVINRLESEIVSADSKIQSLSERVFYLQSQISQLKPNSGVSSEKIKKLESELSSLLARYSESHPDVIKVKRQIESLKKSDDKPVVMSTSKELVELRNKLIDLQSRYDTDHPDVQALQKQIKSKEKELENESVVNNEFFSEDPAYNALNAQLNSAKSELKSAQKQREIKVQKLQQLEQIISLAPEIEREYLALKRDYANAVAQYNSTKSKLMLAESAKQLESESKGERFTLIDPPALPQKPISPNRPAILFLGFVLAIAGGVGFAFGIDFISGAIHGEHNIRNLLGVPPLAVIPKQLSAIEIQKRIQARKRFFIIAAFGIIISIILIHLLVSPLDVLWFRLMRKIDLFMG